MKKYFLSATAILLLAGAFAQADVNKKKDDLKEENKKNKMKEYDEIVIKRKDPNKDTKVTIEIKDDKVFIDGKPLDEFVDDELSVQKRGINKFNPVHPSSPFRLEDGGWTMDDFDMDLDMDMDIDTGGGTRAFLGVTSEGSSGGVKILSVSENSAAAKAGLKKDDIITKVNDKTVFDHDQLSEAIAAYKPDDKVTITYKRDGREQKATATLGKRPRSMAYGPKAPMGPMPPMVFDFKDGDMGDLYRYHNNGRPKLGIKVQDTEDGKGVKVLEVDEGSAADKAGIRENDIITSFEGNSVNSAEELAKASRETKDKTSMKVQLNRNGKPQTIEVKVPKKLRTANL